jgi:hypothetical protein
MSTITVEPYLAPKGLAEALHRDHGLTMTADYIRAIRTECERRKNGVFVAGDARATELIAFLKRNPGFRRSKARAKQ